MATIRQILASIGIGTAGIEIILDQDEHPRGAQATGKIKLTGGWAPQQVQSVYLFLEPIGSTTTLEAHRLDAPFVLLPHAVRVYRFAIDIPFDAPLSSTPSGDLRGCKLRVAAVIRHTVRPQASVNLNVTINREIQAVHAAMSRAGFVHVGGNTYAADPPPDVTRAVYTPPARLRSDIHEAVLFVQVDNGRVCGDLCFVPTKTGLQDRVNALAGLYADRYPLRFHSDELVTGSGTLMLDAALVRITEIVDRLAHAIAAGQNVLLRPGDAPDDATLLRPATGSYQTNPDELLRPAEDKRSDD